MERGLAKWTKELQSMENSNSPSNGRKQNHSKPEVKIVKPSVGAEAPEKKEVNVSPKAQWTLKMPGARKFTECF